MRLLAQVRRAGRVRRERTDWATLLVAIFVLAGFPVQVIIGVTTQAAPDGSPVIPQGLWLAAGVVLAAVIFAVSTAIGPVRVSLPEYSWVLGGPIDRRSELTPRWAGLLLVTGAVGAVAGVVGPAFGGADAVVVAGGGVLGCGLGLGIAAAATHLQGRPSPVRRLAQRAVMAAVVVSIAAATVLAATRTSFAIPTAVVLLGATVAVVFAVVATTWGWRAVAALDRVALTAGNALFNATSAAVLFLEPGLLGDVLAERRLSTLRITRVRSFPAGRVQALLAAEVVRTLRNRRAFGVLLAAVLVVYAAALVVPGRWLPVVGLLCAVPAVSPFGSGFRRISQSASLRRMLGGTDALLRAVHLVLPAAASLVFVVAVAPTVPSARWAALALIPVGIIVNLWARTKGKPAVSADRVGDLGFGPVPIDLTWYYVREIAPLAITLALQLAI
jgi:hypothetical protein